MAGGLGSAAKRWPFSASSAKSHQGCAIPNLGAVAVHLLNGSFIHPVFAAADYSGLPDETPSVSSWPALAA